MTTVIVKLKAGEERRFEDGRRSGGSYCNKVRYEGVFVIVEDEWGARTAFPAADVAEVFVAPEPRSW